MVDHHGSHDPGASGGTLSRVADTIGQVAGSDSESKFFSGVVA